MIKLMDLVWCNNRNLTGQVVRIRHNKVTTMFVTGERVKKNINDIINVNGQWRMND